MSESTATRSRAVLPAVLVAACVALVTAGIVLLVRAHHLRDTGAAANHAVVDQAATTQLTGQITTALNAVLSYDYRHPDIAQAASKRWLTDDAPAQYRELFAQLRTLAAGQNLTLTARVNKVGVESLRGSTARLLVFLDQSSTRASDGQSSVSAAQVQITAVKRSGGWRISELKPL